MALNYFDIDDMRRRRLLAEAAGLQPDDPSALPTSVAQAPPTQLALSADDSPAKPAASFTTSPEKPFKPDGAQTAIDKYRQVMSQMPTPEDYAPSRGRKILAAFAGGLTGLRDPALGVRTAQTINEQPYNTALGSWQNALKGSQGEASLELTSQARELAAQRNAAYQSNVDSETERRKNQTLIEQQKASQQAKYQQAQNEINQAKLTRDPAALRVVEEKVKWLQADDPDKTKGDALLQLIHEGQKPTTKSPEQQYLDEYQQTHPGSSVADAITSYQKIPKYQQPPQGMMIVPGAAPDQPGKAIRVAPGANVPGNAITTQGQSTLNIPTTQSRSMAEMAQSVTQQVPSLLSQIDELKSKLGPAVGRWNQLWVNKVGLNDPAFAGLDQDLDLFASALVRTHFGARGGQGYREALKRNFTEAQSPEDLKARIQHAENWIEGYSKMGSKSPVSNTPTATHRFNPQTGQIEEIK